MPVEFRILKNPNLLYITYSGVAGYDETLAASQACGAHPDFYPEIPHFFDLSAVTDHERNFAEYFAMQAKMIELYVPAGSEILAVFFAPTPAAQRMATLAHKSWSEMGGIVISIVDDYDDALAVLGLDRSALNQPNADV